MNLETTSAQSDGSQELAALAGKYLTFSLANEDFGLEIIRVREIIGLQEITPVPRTPDFVLGVINLRGKVIPVIDLRCRFDMPVKEADERTCIIVVEVLPETEAVLMGIVVDSVDEVSEIKSDELEATPNFGVALDTSFIMGLAKCQNSRVKTLLDIDRVLTQSEVAALGSM
jgi:purine-binding chemotaxis protein CheW